MSWHAQLKLDYSFESQRSVARHLHHGPLRILQSLYPEGDAVCHNVLVHPPGGLVGGDRLDIEVTVAAQAHGLVTTPGATRFYRSAGERALQHTHIKMESGARLEWLPAEAICYDQCLAENHLRFDLAPGAEMMGWDVTALGLPQAQQPFVRGELRQHLEMPGVWLERARINAQDSALMERPLGLNSQRCVATLFFLAGTPLERTRRERALEAARAAFAGHALAPTVGATSPCGQVVLVRALAPLVEPAVEVLRRVWSAWRAELWAMPATQPRIWAM